jgi:hypothetical protein
LECILKRDRVCIKQNILHNIICPYNGSMSYVVGLPNNSYKPMTNTAWVRARLCELQKKCTPPAVTSDKVYQLLANVRWFSPGTPSSSTNKTCRHDIEPWRVYFYLKFNNYINLVTNNTLFPHIVIVFLIR